MACADISVVRSDDANAFGAGGQAYGFGADHADPAWGVQQYARLLQSVKCLVQALLAVDVAWRCLSATGCFGQGARQGERAFQLFNGGRHIQLFTLSLDLLIRTDKHPPATPNRPPAIGAQLKPFPTFLARGVHQMPQVQLALATVFGAELDVLLPPRVVQAQFVVGRSAQDVAALVAGGDRVRVAVIVQGVGDVGAVGVAVFEGDGHFGAGLQREVQAVGVAAVGSGQAQPGAFAAGLPGVTVEQEAHFVAAFEVEVGVRRVDDRVADAGGDGAAHARLGQQRWAKAHGFRVGNGLEVGDEAAVAGRFGAQADDHRAGPEGLRRAAGDVEALRRGQDGAAGGAAEAGLVVEVELMAQTGVEETAFALQVLVQGVALAQHRVGFAVVIGLAVGALGTSGVVDFTVQKGMGLAVMVGAKVDPLLDHPVGGLQVPDGILAIGGQARRRAARQRDAALVVPLVVVKFHHVDVQAIVAGDAVPDADLGQQALDEGQVALVVLHDLFAPGVLAHQVEIELLATKIVARAQDVLDDLRHRLLLVDAKLLAAPKPRETRLQGDFIAGFVVGAGQALEA